MSDCKLSTKRNLGRLLDIACRVCGDQSSGRHYGVFSCDGCSGFFKRTIHKKRVYVCKRIGESRGTCPMDKSRRNQCRACRLDRCYKVHMNENAVQHERGPRRKADTFKRSAGRSTDKCRSTTPKLATDELVINCQTSPDDHNQLISPGTSTITEARVCNLISTSKKYCYGNWSDKSEYCNWTEKCYTRTWAYRQPMFENLCASDQNLLFENGCQQLYMLDKLFWENMIWSYTNQDHSMPLTCCQLHSTMSKQLGTRFKYQLMDAVELSCLKMLVLYDPDLPGLEFVHYVEAIHNDVHVQLQDHIRVFYPGEITRYGRLLLLIPSLTRREKCRIQPATDSISFLPKRNNSW